MRVVVSGSSGLIGSALCTSLTADGHEVVKLVRRSAGQGEIQWDPKADSLSAGALEGADAVVHLAGAGIGDHRWTDSYKAEILDSRVRSTELLASAIVGCANGPKVMLSGSAVGYYGDSGERELDETSPAGSDFLADVCRQWEAATSAAEAGGVRVVHLRTGIVLAGKGGALGKMLPLFKLGVGGRFGNGRQWQSWISLPDEVAAIRHLLTGDVRGAVNLTGPTPVTGSEFAKTLGKVLHRPSLIPVPSFGPKLLLGSELVDGLLLSGQRALPRALQASGFQFQHETLEVALRAVLAR
ncbi:MAG: TIGR01777 family oxidoreductase [Actinomycetia bacterium]|nr:TIGR01777 family oxidoreductase [Actinomycetes bacterium]